MEKNQRSLVTLSHGICLKHSAAKYSSVFLFRWNNFSGLLRLCCWLHTHNWLPMPTEASSCEVMHPTNCCEKAIPRLCDLWKQRKPSLGPDWLNAVVWMNDFIIHCVVYICQNSKRRSNKPSHIVETSHLQVTSRIKIIVKPAVKGMPILTNHIWPEASVLSVHTCAWHDLTLYRFSVVCPVQVTAAIAEAAHTHGRSGRLNADRQSIYFAKVTSTRVPNASSTCDRIGWKW